MATKYTHLKLGEEVSSGIAGYYVPEKEVRLPYNGREVLYVVGEAVIESPCRGGLCSAGSRWYGIVPGYIINWQREKNDTGLPVSDVEPVTDETAKTEIRDIIRETEDASPIGFW